MLVPAYRRLAAELGLPLTDEMATSLRASIPESPAFPDSVDALERLRATHRLVAYQMRADGLLGTGRARIGDPFDDIVTVEDIIEFAQALRIAMTPVLDTKGVADDPQMAARSWWEQADGDTLRFPGQPFHLSVSPARRRGPAPANLAVPPYEFVSDTRIRIGQA